MKITITGWIGSEGNVAPAHKVDLVVDVPIGADGDLDEFMTRAVVHALDAVENLGYIERFVTRIAAVVGLYR